jgi:homocysteine S-methyltransferase
MSPSFEQTLNSESLTLMEGALVERLRRDASVELDPSILNAGLVYSDEGRSALGRLYRQYLDIGRDHDLNMLTLTATWRANPERLKLAGFDESMDVNSDCVSFCRSIRDEYGEYARKVFIGGLMGCKGDAYKPEEALSAGEAAAFHLVQASSLADAGVDFLFAATLPALSESIGIAAALAGLSVPYVLSFVLMPTGHLLDGTSVNQAISVIDSSINPAPLFYMANCVHPRVFGNAMAADSRISPRTCERLIGLQANTSTRSPEELDGLEFLDSDDPDSFSEAMLELNRRFGTRILGGCCGTDDRHIRSIARRAAESGA